MLQHASGTWTWGRYVIVHPAGNTDFEEASSRYRALLVDQATFSSAKVEELLETNVWHRPPEPCAIGIYPADTGSSTPTWASVRECPSSGTRRPRGRGLWPPYRGRSQIEK